MKTIHRILALICLLAMLCALALAPTPAYAQDAAPPEAAATALAIPDSPSTPDIAPAAQIQPSVDPLADLLAGFVRQWPWLSTVLLVVGFLRLLIKPIVEMLRARVRATADPSDDARLARAEASWWWKTILFLLDWTASIKPITPAK